MSTLTLWNSFRELDEVQNRLGRLFGGSINRLGNGEGGLKLADWSPQVDIAEDDKEYIVKADLPEIKKDEVKVTVENGVLSISGERKSEKEEKTKKHHRIERSYGSFERTFTMPEDADSSKMKAEFKDGVLRVHMPKNPAAQPKKFDVKVDKAKAMAASAFGRRRFMRLRTRMEFATRALFVGTFILLSGCAGLGPRSAQRLTPSEKMMWSTYAIGTSKGMATCIIVNRKDRSAAHGVVPVLVTATHVLDVAPHGPYFLAIRTANPNGNPNVSILAFKPAWLAQAVYTHHPQQDIAALELRIPEEMAGLVELPSFIDENAIGRPGDEPHAGDAVSMLGFPKVFPGTEGAFPILRAARIASYSPGAPHDREKFLVNANAYSGDSGGPVFAGRRHDRRPILLGLMIERIGEKAGEVPLAVAVDAHAIRETLQLLAQHGDAIASHSTPPAFGADAPRNSTLKLKGPPEMFFKVVHAKKSAALPLPIATRN